jgi:hypothetical protein
VSTLDRCMIRDLPDPQGSMRYLEASTIPLTPPSITGPSGCSTDVSTMTHAPLGRSVLQDLTRIENCYYVRLEGFGTMACFIPIKIFGQSVFYRSSNSPFSSWTVIHNSVYNYTFHFLSTYPPFIPVILLICNSF